MVVYILPTPAEFYVKIVARLKYTYILYLAIVYDANKLQWITYNPL